MEGLLFYTVYFNPSDYPGKYVVRKTIVNAGGVHHAEEAEIIAQDLESARKVIPWHLHRMDPWPGDDPAIFEIWL